MEYLTARSAFLRLIGEITVANGKCALAARMNDQGARFRVSPGGEEDRGRICEESHAGARELAIMLAKALAARCVISSGCNGT